MLYIEIFDSAYYETKNIIYQETAIGLDQFRSRKSYDDLFDAMLNHFESE
jgi:hypothetical protein